MGDFGFESEDDLVTARLVLHPLSVREAEQAVAGESREGTRWAPGYREVSGAVQYLATWAQTGDPKPFSNFQIRSRADGRAIGGIGFHGPADENGGVTIGYGLVPEARGDGYASEALRAILSYARTHGAAFVEGETSRENVASQRVMAAAGMRLVAEDAEGAYYRFDCGLAADLTAAPR